MVTVADLEKNKGGIGLERERKMFYLTTHSTHFIYGYMASDIWLRTILIVRKETRCRHIGYSYRLTARVLLYAPSHRQDITYYSLCYTSRGVLVGTRNRSMGRIGLESTGRWSNDLGSLNPKCQYEYQEMRRGVATPLYSHPWIRHWVNI